MDKRKFNGGHKNCGRKKGLGISFEIKKHCDKMIKEMLEDEAIRLKATKQLSMTFEEEKDSYLYIIENNGLYKIGYTSNWSKRSKLYNTHLGNLNVVYLFKNRHCYEIEQDIHKLFASKNSGQNEWFELCDKDILKIISYCSSKID